MSDEKNKKTCDCGCCGEEQEEVETIVFEDQDGNEVEFIDVGLVEHEGKEYLALMPYEAYEHEACHCEDGECDCCHEEEEGGIMYCEIVTKGNEEEELVPVNDDALNETLHAKFLEILEEQMSGAEEEEDDK